MRARPVEAGRVGGQVVPGFLPAGGISGGFLRVKTSARSPGSALAAEAEGVEHISNLPALVNIILPYLVRLCRGRRWGGEGKRPAHRGARRCISAVVPFMTRVYGCYWAPDEAKTEP